MAITFTYPIVTPKADDLIIGTQTPDPSSSETDTPTRNFTIQSIIDLVSTTSFVTIGGSQTITGAKTFTTDIAAPNVGGDNTGDQSLSISGSVITISGTNSSVTVPSGLALGTTSTTALAGNTTVITTTQATGITNSVKNDTDTYTSTPSVTKIITLTQAQYAAITTPDVYTLYIII